MRFCSDVIFLLRDGEPAQASAAYFEPEDFAHLAIRKPLHLEPPEPPIFWESENYLLVPAPSFQWGRRPIAHQDRSSPHSRTSDAILKRDSCMLSGPWEICSKSHSRWWWLITHVVRFFRSQAAVVLRIAGYCYKNIVTNWKKLQERSVKWGLNGFISISNDNAPNQWIQAILKLRDGSSAQSDCKV